MKINYVFTNFLVEDQLDLDLSKLKIFCCNEKKSDAGRNISNYGGWQSKNIEIVGELMPMVDAINCMLKKICKHSGLNDNVKIDNLWININQKSNFNTPHIHAESLFSGVFYVSAPDRCGNIVFKNPNPLHSCFISSKDITNYNDFNAGTWFYEPKPNMILIFPSWVEHYVMPNESDEDRISISFNASISEDVI